MVHVLASGLPLPAKLLRDVANVPVPITLVPVTQRPLNHLQRVNRQRRIREKPFCFARGGEPQCHSLRVKRLHVKQRADLGASEPACFDELLGKVAATGESPAKGESPERIAPLNPALRGVIRGVPLPSYGACELIAVPVF